jgi:hypothetical protein
MAAGSEDQPVNPLLVRRRILKVPLIVNANLGLTAYHFCGAISHLNILSRGGGR